MTEKKEVMQKRQLILVEWEDITGSGKWHSEEEAEKVEPMKCFTVGWRMKSDRKHLTIASTRNTYNECLDRTTMPRSSIRSIRRLE